MSKRSKIKFLHLIALFLFSANVSGSLWAVHLFAAQFINADKCHHTEHSTDEPESCDLCQQFAKSVCFTEQHFAKITLISDILVIKTEAFPQIYTSSYFATHSSRAPPVNSIL